MPNLKHIKTKIKSITNLKKITKALEIVSTVKLQKTKAKADNMKHYIVELMSILAQVWQKTDLFEIVGTPTKETSKKELAIIVSSDRGLCGSLNSKLMKKIISDTSDYKQECDCFIIGKKWFEVCNRLWYPIVWLINIKDNFDESDLLSLFTYFEQSVLSQKYQSIKIYFNYFKNILTQVPTSLQIYPLTTESFQLFMKDVDLTISTADTIKDKDLVIEPDKTTLVTEIRRQIKNYIIMSAIIQNKTGEHASRMLAMKNAKDNSTGFIKSLTLTFNKARQSVITQEISEIVSAKIAIEG